MRVLFAGVLEHSPEADTHRAKCLAEVMQGFGVHVDMLGMDEGGWFFRGPVARQFRFRWRKVPWDEYDFFHVHSAIVAVMLSRQRKGGAKIIFDCQGLIHAEMQLRRLRGLNRLRVPLMRRFERRAARVADLCITVSKPLMRWLAQNRGSETDIALIRNGVSAEMFRPTTETGSRRNAGVFVVGYAGAFQNWQAVDLLIDAAKDLADRTDIQWRIIGFRRADQQIKRRLAADLPEGSELFDRCDRTTLVHLLQGCDLLVIPRKPCLACAVALPTKFAEYLAMAKTVLVNTVDETQDIVRQTGCGFVAESDPHAMAEAIRRAAETPPEQLRAMGQAGRAYVMKNLNWDTIGQRYKEFLKANL